MQETLPASDNLSINADMGDPIFHLEERPCHFHRFSTTATTPWCASFAYQRSESWQGCLQCLAESRLTHLTDGRSWRRAGLRAAYVSGEILACRQFLDVPHSCDRDGMASFLAGTVRSGSL